MNICGLLNKYVQHLLCAALESGFVPGSFSTAVYRFPADLKSLYPKKIYKKGLQYKEMRSSIVNIKT